MVWLILPLINLDKDEKYWINQIFAEAGQGQTTMTIKKKKYNLVREGAL